MFLHTRVLRAFVLAVLSVVSADREPMRARSDEVLLNTLVSYKQPYAQLNKRDQNKDQESHPYFEEPLNKLVKRIPELKGISPAADQQELAIILRRTGATVDELFANIVNLIAHEEITQERLTSVTVDGGMPGGLIGSNARVRDSYLILRHVKGSRAEISEFRMNDKGIRMDEVGPDKGFFMTSGFALSSVHFSSAVQWESRFLHLGDQKISGKDTHVIAFAQLPSEARNTVTIRAKGVELNMFIQGIAWVDKANFQIVQIRTDLLAPQPDIGLDEQTTKITLREVRFPDVAIPLWLPRDANVYMKFTVGASIQTFRNIHHYTDYRRYRVSTKILTPN